MSTLARIDLPPLLKGCAVGRGDPFAAAVAAARAETEPGLIHYSEAEDALRAAITLAPEEPLGRAVGAILAVELGLADALGALAPPEVAVQFDWPDRLRVNGALCGRVRAAASTRDPETEPDWLVVGVEVAIAAEGDGGADPDRTALHAEGCGEIAAPALLEAWARHTLSWIHHYLSDGLAPLHAAWRGKCDGIGRNVDYPETGHFTGLDERGGMLLRTGHAVRLIPLTHMLEDA